MQIDSISIYQNVYHLFLFPNNGNFVRSIEVLVNKYNFVIV